MTRTAEASDLHTMTPAEVVEHARPIPEASHVRMSAGVGKLHLDLLAANGEIMARASISRTVFARLLKAGADAWPQPGFAALVTTFELSERDRGSLE